MARLFETPISTSNLYAPDFNELCRVFGLAFDRGGELITGRLVEQLEQRLCDYHAAQYCVAFSTGFWALVAAVRLKSLPAQTEVIIPSLTYRRLADVVYWAGKIPRFVDVEPNTLAICPAAVERALSPETALILAVHPIVGCCDVPRLLDISQRADVPIVFDAVESVHETLHSRRIGSFGVGEVFSFHASKLINGLEGGYVCTNDEGFRNRLLNFRNPGGQSRTRTDSLLGLNSVLNDGHAAFALVGLQEISRNIEHNREIYQTYLREISSVAGINLKRFDECENTAFKNIVAEVTAEYPLNRDELVTRLNSVGILARAHYSPALHRKTYEYRVHKDALPVTDWAANRLVNLPCGQRVSSLDVVTTCRFLRDLTTPATSFQLPQVETPNPEKPATQLGHRQLTQQNYEDVFSQIYRHGYFTNHGPLAQHFESLLESYLNIEHVVSVGNDALALLIALAGLEIDGEVILPAWCSETPLEIGAWLGLRTILVDVEIRSQQPSIGNLQAALTRQTSAVILVETWGNRCDPDTVKFVCERGLKLIVVAFDSFGISAQQRLVADHPDVVTVFSFGPEKILSTWQGGAIAVSDGRLAEKFRNIRSSYGVREPMRVRATCNGRFSEFQAGVGIKSLALVQPLRDYLQQLSQIYSELLTTCPGIQIFSFPFNDFPAGQHYPIIVTDLFPLTRNQLGERLRRMLKDDCPNLVVEWRPPRRFGGWEQLTAGDVPSTVSFPVSRELNWRILELPFGRKVSESLARQIATIINSLADEHH